MAVELEARVVPSAEVTAAALPEFAVRVAYAIPSTRTAQPEGVASIRNRMLVYRDWLRDQMERNGFGPKTFSLETEADGVTPKVHVVGLPQSAAYYRVDPFGRVRGDLNAAGLPVFSDNAVWAVFYEGIRQNADGTLEGQFFGGAINNAFSTNATVGGFALLGGDAVANINPSRLTDQTDYDGVVDPRIGPHPLRFGVSYASGLGETFSQISSAAVGAVLHEMGHGFGLPHDFRNDDLRGNLMGNGHRSFRGYLRPDLFPREDTHLEYGNALALNTMPYFNPGRAMTDFRQPEVSITSTPTAPVAGQLRIGFRASDDGDGASGLAVAQLWDAFSMIDELPLSGSTFDGSFDTPFYTPGEDNRFDVWVYDRQGNRTRLTTFVTPDTGSNRAPIPYMQVHPERFAVGQPVVLDASLSSDPDGDRAQLRFQWDVNDDGVFDTALSSSPTFTTSFETGGTRRIRLRVVDAAGGSAESAPVGIRVVGPAGPAMAVTGYTLINAATDQPIGSLTDGSTINLATLPTRQLNVRANTTPATVGSVRFAFDAATTFTTENAAPYALFSDAAGDYKAGSLPVGTHTLKATPFAGANATGTAGAAPQITFTVIDQPPRVLGFTLINADTDQPIRTLTNGATLDLSQAGTTRLNVRANVSGPVGSVRFGLDANLNFATENAAPFALFSDRAGDYFAGSLAVGTRTIRATPFAGPNRTGATGQTLSIVISVVP